MVLNIEIGSKVKLSDLEVKDTFEVSAISTTARSNFKTNSEKGTMTSLFA